MTKSKSINGDIARLHSNDGIRKAREVKRLRMDFKEIKEIYESKIGKPCSLREENTMFINFIRLKLGLDFIPRVYQKGSK